MPRCRRESPLVRWAQPRIVLGSGQLGSYLTAQASPTRGQASRAPVRGPHPDRMAAPPSAQPRRWNPAHSCQTSIRRRGLRSREVAALSTDWQLTRELNEKRKRRWRRLLLSSRSRRATNRWAECSSSRKAEGEACLEGPVSQRAVRRSASVRRHRPTVRLEVGPAASARALRAAVLRCR